MLPQHFHGVVLSQHRDVAVTGCDAGGPSTLGESGHPLELPRSGEVGQKELFAGASEIDGPMPIPTIGDLYLDSRRRLLAAMKQFSVTQTLSRRCYSAQSGHGMRGEEIGQLPFKRFELPSSRDTIVFSKRHFGPAGRV